MRRMAPALLFAAAVACRSEPTPVSVSASATASGAPAVSAAPVATPSAPPPFASITKLVDRSGQGGPAMMRCSGIVSEIELDFVASTFRYGFCPMNADGSTPLTVRTGKLTAADRTALEKAWDTAALVPERCASDAGLHTVEATTARGTNRWSCKEPLDLVARDFQHALFAIVTAKP